MARLIEKENVAEYGGQTVYLETHCGAGLVAIIAVSYRRNVDGSEDPHAVEWSGFVEHGEYIMDEYGITWRLWDVNVETPSVQQMTGEPWEVY